MLSRLALEQERILNPLLDRVRTADHHQLRSLTGLIRNLSRNARNKDEMCESARPRAWALPVHGLLPSGGLWAAAAPGQTGMPAPWGSRGRRGLTSPPFWQPPKW